LAALGDVIRTLCILPELRRLYPAAHITWVSQANGCRMLAGHAMIDRVLPFDALTSLVLG
jgi:ADP-heptose:LPS heptosyltransferase